MVFSENKQRMLRGELYHAFTPELSGQRRRCGLACAQYNNAGNVPRRRLVELLRDVMDDDTPLPPPAATPEEDDELFKDDPWIGPPIAMDYGYNVKIGKGVFVNFNSVFLDTCLIAIGDRTMVGPNVSFYSAMHPLDPAIRDGLRGPELGKEIHVQEDCWIGGNVVILPGVTIGRGSTVGAGSVVTKDVPEFTVVAGNPAKIIRKIETQMDPAQRNAGASA
ncbi:mannose-1-phosphate guanylyltransferase [Parastagonospora nodorum]|nr:mannose-1-phosphate guanylyltransferase [Parastagonospora nodorum]KAH6057576.1 mannose-1-phosphate guanylyltransferase [Parastagonospora nodorum]KAH6066613.1 mannose-1-phosphate guanylyltransferase [Parastagonospora nodorum]KAH6292857.1 mannose-1-phosphate guanylyltransferase [Parastagonospora nodorum]